MFIAALVLIILTGLFGFYLRALRQKILRRKFTQEFSQSIVNANHLEFPSVRKAIEDLGSTVEYPHQFRILVVDDDPKSSDFLTTKLNLSGFTSQSCTNGESALKLLSTEGFDAIISALNLPGISGLELLAEVHRQFPRTAFLMATGVGDIAVGVSAMKLGAADYILKPFQMEDVVASLRRALEMNRTEAELEQYRLRLEEMVEQRTNQLKAAMGRIELTYDETLEALSAALSLCDKDTAAHSRRVALHALEIAKRLNFSPDQLKQLERGALLHDIGKIGIPDLILLKPGKLTPEEMEVMKTHVRIGYELMSRVAFLASPAQIVLTHQECYDGTGYPQGLAGEQIPMGARIVAVANAFDTMCSKKTQKGKRSVEEAVAELRRCSGTQFDPNIVEAFVHSRKLP